jgi:hypothetical protein
MTGVTYVADEEEGVSPIEQAELMIALFQSIDRDCFELRVSAKNGQVLEALPNLGPDDIRRRLPELVREAEHKNLSVAIRPADNGRQGGLGLLRLDDLDALALDLVQPSAFMILEIDQGVYQCWFAVDSRQMPSPANSIATDKLPATQDPFAPLAGSRRTATAESPRVRIARGSAGLVMPPNQLANQSIQLLLEKCMIQ